jgi:hypothetical protein
MSSMHDFLNRIRPATKLFFLIGIIILLYGYLCRTAALYFFWESLPVGWNLIFLSIILLLVDLIKSKKAQNKKVILEKICMGALIFLLVAQLVFILVIPRTDAWQAAKKYIDNDQSIQSEIGNVKALSIIPAGNISVSSGPDGEYGVAEIHLTIKGSNKYKDCILYLEKEPQSDWLVRGME